MIEALSWVAAISMFLANFVLIKTKDWRVFIAMAVANAMYIGYWVVKQEWATLILVCLFFSQNIYGLIKWRKDARNNRR